MRDAAHPLARDSLRQEARAVLKWLGVAKSEAIEIKHHVQFARAYERYVMERQAPSGTLAPAFATLSESLTNVYGTPQSLKVALNNDIRSVFNRLLAMPDQIATCTAASSNYSRPFAGAPRRMHPKIRSTIATNIDRATASTSRSGGLADKLTGFFQRWRDARAEAAAKRADLQRRFKSFLLETEPLFPNPDIKRLHYIDTHGSAPLSWDLYTNKIRIAHVLPIFRNLSSSRRTIFRSRTPNSLWESSPQDGRENGGAPFGD